MSDTNEPVRTIAYLMSRFPKISETFILDEMISLQRMGMRVEVFPLIREHESVVHPDVRTIEHQVHYSKVLSVDVLRAQFHWLLTNPVRYLRAWFRAVRGNIRSTKFLLRALAVVPQAALWARQMQELGVDRIHAHWATHPTLAAYTVHVLTDLPFSFTGHAVDLYVNRTMLAEKMHAAEFVVTISEYNRRLLATVSPDDADKIEVIRCGVDTAAFLPPPTRTRDASGPFTILCVGRLAETKGHTYLVDACARLAAQGLHFRCLLVGDGPLRGAIEEQIARLGIAEFVTLLGFQPRETVRELMMTSDVFVLASIMTDTGDTEGIPVALMEALAAERPVVATSVSGIPELISDGETGLLVPQRDAEALADALSDVQRDPLSAGQLGAAGRKRVLAEYDQHVNISRLYELLCGRPPSTETDAVRSLATVPS